MSASCDDVTCHHFSVRGDPVLPGLPLPGIPPPRGHPHGGGVHQGEEPRLQGGQAPGRGGGEPLVHTQRRFRKTRDSLHPRELDQVDTEAATREGRGADPGEASVICQATGKGDHPIRE